jgi:hypothetical protein
MPNPSARSFGPLVRFLLLHAVALVVVHLVVGWCWVLAYQPNEFAGLGLVIALKATPVLVGLSAPFHAWIWHKAGADRRNYLALGTSFVWVGLFNLPYLV